MSCSKGGQDRTFGGGGGVHPISATTPTPSGGGSGGGGSGGGSGGGAGGSGGGGGSSGGTIRKIQWINFSPYVYIGQSPDNGTVISDEQLRDLLRKISNFTEGIRLFGSSDSLRRAAAIAKNELGLKVAQGAWLNGSGTDDVEIQSIINSCNQGLVDIAICGSETLYRGELAPASLIAYIQQVKASVPSNVLVSTADTWFEMMNAPEIRAVCDVIMYNVYPYWEGVSAEDGLAFLVDRNNQMVSVSGGEKQVIISETGFPICGPTRGEALPSIENGALYFSSVINFARETSIELMWFSAFREPWKVAYEGSVGECWPVFETDGTIVSGFETVFEN